MKRFLLTIGLMAAITIAFSSCANTNTTNQAIDNSTAVSSPVETPVPTPTAAVSTEPAVTTREAVLDKNVFTDETYGYKVTVPAGYTVIVEETRYSDPSVDGRDRVIINDAQGQEFATIRTPAPEVGFELWTWPMASRSASKIPGSNDYIYRYEVPGEPAMEMKQDLIAASWGFDLHDDGVAATRAYDQQGLISAEVPALDSPATQKVRTLINSLRLI